MLIPPRLLSIERVCVSASLKEQICLLCVKVVSNNDFRRKLTTSGGRKKQKLVSVSSQYWERGFHNQGILDSRTHCKPTESFQYTHFSSCNPHGIRKGHIKGEALSLLRTNSSAKSFYENIYNFKKCLCATGYPHNLIEKITSEVKFTERKSALQKNNEVRKKILPFVTTYHPALQNLKNILMSKWHLIQDQPLLREIYKEPPIISYKRGKSLRDILIRAKLYGHVSHYHKLMSRVWPVNTFHFAIDPMLEFELQVTFQCA